MAAPVRFTDYTEAGPSLLTNPDRKIQASFRAAPMHVTVANTIRRQVLSAVPTVGFKTEPPEASDIHIEVNTTPLVNEMLMHRIGMIPIAVTDPSTFNPEEYEFRINIENVGRTPVNVTASDFVVVKKMLDGSPEVQLKTADFFPPDPITKETALITVLRPQYNMDSPPEKLSIRAIASVGTGRQNMRYSSVAQCSYEYTLDQDASKRNALFLSWMATSKKVPDPSKVSPDRMGELQREFDTLEVQRCYLQNEKGEPYDFTFHVESVGVFSVGTILHRAIVSCAELVTPYTALDVELPSNVVINKAVHRMAGGFEMVFQNEEHTLGNLIQTYLIERHVEGTEMPRLAYAGYKVPHPLRQEMVLLVAATDGEQATVIKAVAQVCTHLKAYFESLAQTWESAPKADEPKPVQKTVQAAAAAPAAARRATKRK
uniref:DNA-directed RNA polymerase RpoA/D/Rpb3-type domain-containing protein n=1 Tax=viral metagenome TaxID=1070528 RepID=A0A6C0DRS8_9ZZZZ